jgi:hypothetical protein
LGFQWLHGWLHQGSAVSLVDVPTCPEHFEDSG